MNTSHKYRHPKRSVKPVVLALALAMPGSAALAASTNDVVTTRADQSIDQQYGRGSIYAFSPDAKPMKSEQAGSNVFGTMKTYAAEAWHKTEGFAVAAWDKTTDFFTQPPAVAQTEPQRYGRAGGYVGADRIAVLESHNASQANAAPNETVKTGEGAMGAFSAGPAATFEDTSVSAPLPQDRQWQYQGQMDNGSSAASQQAPVMGAEDQSQSVRPDNPDSVSAADTGTNAFAQPTSDVALEGEAEGQWESVHTAVTPPLMEVTPELRAMDDGTATQYDRGYYKDPDQSAVVVMIVSDNTAMEGDQSASAEEQSSSASAD